MNIISKFKTVYYWAKIGWHHGKAGKFLKRLDYQAALKHYELAYEYSRFSEDETSQALELECMARTHYRLNEFGLARQHAEKSLAIYQEFQAIDKSGVFSAAVSRVQDLMARLQT